MRKDNRDNSELQAFVYSTKGKGQKQENFSWTLNQVAAAAKNTQDNEKAAGFCTLLERQMKTARNS